MKETERERKLQAIYDRLMAEQTSPLTELEYAYICREMDVPIGVQNGDEDTVDSWFTQKWGEYLERKAKRA